MRTLTPNWSSSWPAPGRELDLIITEVTMLPDSAPSVEVLSELYRKPTIATLGSAEEVIEIVNQVKFHTQIEGLPGQRNAPAYDLDE
jgi:hypothetical protein